MNWSDVDEESSDNTDNLPVIILRQDQLKNVTINSKNNKLKNSRRSNEECVDIDAIPDADKHWRNPGANQSDYFNYGFNETTWKSYIDKQKLFRAQKTAQKDKYDTCNTKTTSKNQTEAIVLVKSSQ